MKDGTRGVDIEVFAEMRSNIYLFLVDDTSKHRKANGPYKNVFTTINHSKCKDILLNNKCLMHSMTRIQRKNQRIGTYEIGKFHWPSLMTKYISKTIDMTD